MDDIKKSIYYTVAQICTQEGERSQFEVTDEAIASMCEMVMGFSDCLAKDLEAFSAHAKRSTVNPSDVRLAARKQPHIVTKLEEMAGALDEEKRKKRKKNDSN